MSLVELGWRQFTFFEKHNVYDPERPKEKFNGLKDLKACCSASGDGFTLFGERCGAIFKLSKKLEEYFWIAHKYSLSDFSLAGNILATVGEDEDGVNSLVKLWQLDRVEKDAPFCLRVIRACPLLGSNQSIRACSVALHPSLQHIAIGYIDSSVVYHYGNIIKDRSNKFLVVVNGMNSGDEVTGLALAWLQSRSTCILYSMTSSSVKSFAICNKAIVNSITHDAKGCLRDCWSFCDTVNRLIVGSSEMVYFYEAEHSMAQDPDSGRGKCHALGRSNEKVQLLAFQNHVALLTRQPAAVSSSDGSHTWVVSIYDVDGQCVAFSCALPAVSRMFLLDSVLMVLTQDGSLAAFTEKHISVKLDVLFKKNLFDLAVGLAKRSPIGAEYLPEIHTKYGDYLYKSGDFENSVQQYMETVGSLEPSYVIKKFLDGSRIKELCSYLEILHTKGKASAQHTTILLNCYTKMGARDKIENFIDQNLDCELDVAVQVLRASNFSSEACRLCEKHNMHEQLLSILIEEREDYVSALKVIEDLDPRFAERYLEKYGKLLLEKCPDETMGLLVRLITVENGDVVPIDAGRLMKMFVGDANHCTRFVEIALKADNKNLVLRDIMLELRLRQWMLRSENSPDMSAEIISLIGNNFLEQALQLCQMFDFAPGIIDIYTKLEKFDELIEYHMRQNDLKGIIKLCELKNSQKLWIDAIVFASQEENIDSSAIKYLLERLEQTNCVHPLVVLEILSRSNNLLVDHVKDYIVRWLHRHNDQTSSDEKTITEMERKMTEIEEQIESLNYKVQIFQQSKCSACDTSLQLPAVHFLCKHSYHVHCLESYSEKADCCPACTRVTADTRIGSRGSESFYGRTSYKHFQEQVNSAVDCMSLVSSYIGSGLFDIRTKLRSTSLGVSGNVRTGTDENKISEGGTNPFEGNSSVTSSTRSSSRNSQPPPVTTNPFEEESVNPLEEKIHSTNPFGDDF